MNTKLTSIALSAIVISATLPQVLLAGQSGELSNAADQLQAQLQEAFANLSEDQQLTTYNNRYTQTTTHLDTAETNIESAKDYVPYILGLNTQEKATVYAVLNDVMGQLLRYESAIKAIHDDSSLSTAEKMTQTTDQLEAVLAYLQDEDNQAAFEEMIKSILKEKLEANLIYTQTALTALENTQTSYDAMGQDTTKLAKHLTAAQHAYTLANDSKTAADSALSNDTTSDDLDGIKNYNQAARRMVIVAAQILRAQQQANVLEAANAFSPTYSQE